jgi:hypothetical protein
MSFGLKKESTIENWVENWVENVSKSRDSNLNLLFSIC